MKDEILHIKTIDEEKTDYIMEKQPVEIKQEDGTTTIEEQDVRKEVKSTVKKTYAKMARTVQLDAAGRHDLIRKEYEVVLDGEKEEAEMLAEIAKVSELEDVEEA